MDVAKMMNSADQDDDEVMLPGFRFHPTDEELVGFYLRRKVEKRAISMELIKQIDIYKYDPWDLPKGSSVGEKEWYFFCLRGRKYRNSIRPNRVTGSGFWKATGIDKPIYSAKEPHECIGLKKSLVYYRGSAGKGTKTDWMMHEFRLPPPPSSPPKTTDNIHTHVSSNSKNMALEAEVWTLCRIFKRIPSYRRYTPEFKTTNPRPNPGDSSSKTCSLESDQTSEQYLTFGDSSIIHQQIDHKPVINLINPYNIGYSTTNHQMMAMNHSNMQISHQASHMATYPSFWSTNGEGLFDEGSWDELSSVVELANNGNNNKGSISDSQFSRCV